MQREENRCVVSPPAAGVHSIVRAPAQIFRCHWRPQRHTAIFLPASRHQCAKRVYHLCEKHLAKFATTTFFISFSASNTLRNKGHCHHSRAHFLLCNLLVWHRGAECLAACQCDRHFAAILSHFQRRHCASQLVIGLRPGCYGIVYRNLGRFNQHQHFFTFNLY